MTHEVVFGFEENLWELKRSTGLSSRWQDAESMDGDAWQEDTRRTLEEISRMRMPFGKYGPDHFPPGGVPLYDLPWEYLEWFQRRGFPKGRLGELLEILYHMKADGSDQVFDVYRRRQGGRHPLRKERDREYRADPEA